MRFGARWYCFAQSDYEEFFIKKKYLSAKLLAFFNEHPLIFIGYGASDPNIKAILSDIDEALPERGGLITNVYILEWNAEIDDDSRPAREKVISTGPDRTVRVKLIEAKCFKWVFDAFAANPALSKISTKVLRSLVARSYELVRRDIPRMKIEVDFEMLSSAVEDREAFATLFGIASIDDFASISAQYPFSLTEIGKSLGGKNWSPADKALKKILAETGIDIKADDNKFHRKERINRSEFHKYSHAALDLIKKVHAGAEYKDDL